MAEIISKFYMDRDNKEYFTKLVETLKKNKFCKFFIFHDFLVEFYEGVKKIDHV
jgi:hypothetical protein